MNETNKTLTFWIAAAVMLGIALWVAWPTPTVETEQIAGKDLFEEFDDPQAAASMKIVTFDEEQGQLETFEVRRDRESGLWNIPSRDGYPADAIEQMRTAANALIGLRILDVQTRNAEDHDDLGVVEPKLEELQVGDEGVGRLVTFKDESQETLASIIIGDEDKSDAEKRYVRIPGQDPVYVVKLDESPLTTKFQDWIESDLLQLSSIDIGQIHVEDYTASTGLGRNVSLSRNYAATVEQENSEWNLISLKEYNPEDPLAEPTEVELPEDQKLNTTKLNEIKNALDDLEIVNVHRKPDGMSANLRANKDFLDDREALMSLARNGFYPVPLGADGQLEILAANGELTTTLTNGVKYVLRFGNIAGVADDEDESAEQSDESDDEQPTGGGVNRYLLVTTMVDDSMFPAPELQEVPKTVDELKAMLETVEEEKADPADQTETSDPPMEEDAAGDDEQPASDDQPEPEAKAAANDQQETPADETTETSDSDSGAEESTDPTAESPAAESPAAEGEEQPEEENSASADRVSATMLTAAQDEEAAEEQSEPESSDPAEKSESAEPSDDSDDSDPPAEPPESSEASAPSSESGETGETELTEEEWQERLEAEQEKITKENQRKLDERNDKIETAEEQVRELNARFADWYYVIAEDTYRKLRITRDELFEQTEEGAEGDDAADPAALPKLDLPGIPGQGTSTP